ncbi:MAG: hypothetical protein U9P50_03175 [Patescibacteria group bacterium]|nr:hypothetical protein [Patescibacteria group bacterium]
MDEGIKGILWVFVGIGLIWLFLGGPGRMTSREGLFIKPPSPLDSGETYGKVPSWEAFKNSSNYSQSLTEEERIALELKQTQQETEKLQQELLELKTEQNKSSFTGKITISRCKGSKTDVDQEYIKLSVKDSVNEKILISDWSFKSEMTGIEIKIGNASKLPYTSQINTESPLFVSGGDEIIILTGRSPIGVSFQVNKCSGYLEQFQDFNPHLDKDCPLVEDEDLPVSGPNAFNDNCWDYIEKISRCETPLIFPLDMQYECRTYLTNEVNHNTCINNYKNKSGFYKPEWRIFLDRKNELWKKDREIIRLLDAQGKVVDTYSY